MMITIRVDPQDFAAMAPQLPQEQAHGKELMEKGIMEAIFISTDNLHVWMIMNGESQERIEQVLSTFPLYSYMRDVQFISLR